MLAVRSHIAGEPLRIENVPEPTPDGPEVRVRVAGCGVCHTDLHIARTDRLRVDAAADARPRDRRLAGCCRAAGGRPDAPRARGDRRPGARLRRLGLRRLPRVRARRGAALRAERGAGLPARRRVCRAGAGAPARDTSSHCTTWTRSRRRRWPMPGSRHTARCCAPRPGWRPGTRVLLIGFGGLGPVRDPVPAPPARPDHRGARARPRQAGAGRRAGRGPGPAGRRRVAGRAGPGRPRGRRVRLRGQRRDAGLRGTQRGAGRPHLAGRRGGRSPLVRLRPPAGRGLADHHRLGLAGRPARGGAAGVARQAALVGGAHAAAQGALRPRPAAGRQGQGPDRPDAASGSARRRGAP